MEESRLLANLGLNSADTWCEDNHQSDLNSKTPSDGLDGAEHAEKQPPTNRWEKVLQATFPKIISAWNMSRSGRPESKKVAIQHSLIYAILGTMVHIIPVSGVAVVVAINLRGCLFAVVLNNSDTSSEWLPALQFVAKLHDVFMLASLTSLVFSVMSLELCLRKGLPYGAIFSGSQVSHPTFLWSRELWGLLLSEELPKLVIFRMGLAICGAVLLGFAVGPASAALMIPRVRDYPVGSTSFWLNVTESSLFPALLEGSSVDPSCANLSSQMTLDTCPSSGWKGLVGLTSIPGPSIMPEDLTIFQYDMDGDYQNNSIDFLGVYPNTKRSMYPTAPSGRKSKTWQSSQMVMTQSAVLAEALYAIVDMWTQISKPSRTALLTDTAFHTMNATQPYAAVNCSAYGIDGPNDVRPIPFMADDNSIHYLATTNRAELLQVGGDENRSRFQFVDLSNLTSATDNLYDVTLGGIVIDGDRNFTSCIIHSGWASTYLNISDGNGWSITSARFINNLSLRTVNIPTSWADYLNPAIDPSGNTVFDMLATKAVSLTSDSGQLPSFYEAILAAMVANGLANVGVGSTFRGDLKESVDCWPQTPPCDQFTKLDVLDANFLSDTEYFIRPAGAKEQDGWKVNHYVNGLAYSSDGIVVKISIVVLLIYATVVSFHTFYIIVRRHSSSSWQSISELTTLALVSKPPTDPNFQNTSAGIYGLDTFKQTVRVVAMDEKKNDMRTGEELQLVFGKEMPKGFKRLEPNQEYGAAT